jgi:hypothetical protein
MYFFVKIPSPSSGFDLSHSFIIKFVGIDSFPPKYGSAAALPKIKVFQTDRLPSSVLGMDYVGILSLVIDLINGLPSFICTYRRPSTGE